MKTRLGFRGATSAAAICIAAFGVFAAGASGAQQAKYPPGGPKLPQWSALPDWSGLWERGGDIVWDDRIPFKAGEPELPPYTPEFMKEYQARRAEMRADALAGRPRTFKGAGLYGSMPAMMIMLFPMDMQINPHEVVIMTANGGAREIYTDGRVHPADALPSSRGHSIGHWEGKTLVVDTCCFRADTRLPGGGGHSDQMHVTERFWSPDGHALKDAITVEDPKAFTKPWTTEKTYYRRPDWEQVEYDGEENTRDFGKPSPDGEAAFGPPPKAEGAAPPAPTPVAAAAPKPPKPPGKPATTEGLQKATALAVGNLAWETVVVAEAKRSPDKVTWNGVTRSVTWHCSAAPDGTGAYCEQPPAPPGAARPPGAGPAIAAASEPAPARPAGPPTLTKNTVTVGGQDRDYYYFVPPKADRAGFNQVVYALHDNGQTAEQFAAASGWMKLAADNGFVVVFPETVQKDWGPSAGGEDDYLAAVLAHAGTHMLIPAPPGAGGGGPRAGRGGGEGVPEAEAARRGPPRIRTWAPFQYLTGVGAGATLAQAFAMNHPGLYAAVATVDGAANDAAYAKGEQPADGAYLHIWPDKALVPIWKQQKKDVPVATWLFTHGAPTAAGTRQADYWKRADHVAAAATTDNAGGYETTVFTSRDNPAQQVRTTTLPASAPVDARLAGTIWSDLFARVARWTSSPNGDLGRLMTHAEVDKAFEVKSIAVGDRTYTYYVKTPASFSKGQKLPVVLSAHGFAFPAWMYLSQIKLHEVGEKEEFITVYLQGQRDAWTFEDPDGPDQQYILKVIAAVEADYGADPGRVYMQGFSFGSGLTYMMGLTHPELFAAVSPNSGIGPMPKDVLARIAQIKAKSDARTPMLLLYGDADRGGSVDGEIPSQGILRGAIDEVKAYNHITTADTTKPFHSPTAAGYDILVPGAKPVSDAVDARYPQGRFQIYPYSSADPAPRNLFNFVWVRDLTHGGDPRQAQLEWDYFKHWRRNADGSLSYVPR
jgi:poly(3-hydroxybutyrate) depolymerase